MNNFPKKRLKASPKKRMLNEIEAKVQNEVNSDKVSALRERGIGDVHTDTVYSCECDTKNCPENIVMSMAEYAQAHNKIMHFIVVPTHVHLDIEEIIATFKNYSIVKKHFPVLPGN